MIIEGYENTLDKIHLSREDIEAQIARYSLDFSDLRIHKVEYEINIPLCVYTFYQYIIEHNSIPSQNEFWLEYVDKHREELIALHLAREEKFGLRARIYRAYPSLVRDLHFGKVLTSCFEVFYNEVMDTQYGVDLVIKDNNTLYGLNLYTATKNSLYNRKLKEYRPKRPVNFKCLELPLHFDGSLKLGSFFLYSEREIEQIKNFIASMHIE